MQEIQLDKHIKLLDCPGVVFDKTSTTNSVALKNVVSSGNIEDPMACANTIVSRVTKDQVKHILLCKLIFFSLGIKNYYFYDILFIFFFQFIRWFTAHFLHFK